jgi:hypothetical protein
VTVTRYLIKTARGYFRALAHQRPGADLDWTRFPEEAEQWVDVDSCHAACRNYTRTTGESAVVVVHVRPSATLGKALPTPA